MKTTVVDRHPPIDRRCQIYIGHPELFRCRNEGTHWEKWGGCEDDCIDPDDISCEQDFYSWECNGDHNTAEVLDESA